MILLVAVAGLLLAVILIISALRKDRSVTEAQSEGDPATQTFAEVTSGNDASSGDEAEGTEINQWGFITNPDGSLSSPHAVDEAYLASAGRMRFMFAALPSGLTTPPEAHISIDGRLFPVTHATLHAEEKAALAKLMANTSQSKPAETGRRPGPAASGRSTRRGPSESPFEVMKDPFHPANPLNPVYDEPASDHRSRQTDPAATPRSEHQPSHHAASDNHASSSGSGGSSTWDTSSSGGND